MAVENVKRFYEALTDNENLRKELMEKEKNLQGLERNEETAKVFLYAEVMPLAARIGCPFSFEELKEFEQRHLSSLAEGETTDSELDAVCGGSAYCLFAGYNDRTPGRVDAGICIWKLGLTFYGASSID